MVPRHLAIKLVWRALAPSYRAMRGAPEVVDDALLDGVEDEVRRALAAMPAFAARSFALPPGLRAFYRVAQDGLEPVRKHENFKFYACTWLATRCKVRLIGPMPPTWLKS